MEFMIGEMGMFIKVILLMTLDLEKVNYYLMMRYNIMDIGKMDKKLMKNLNLSKYKMSKIVKEQKKQL